MAILTTVLGTVFSMISLHYFKLADLNILFEIEISEFDDISSMNKELAVFLLMFFSLLLIGIFT